MKFSTENECPICMNTYEDILEDDKHTVVSCCGHPVCCNCCDEIMRNDAKCLRCMGVFYMYGFNTIKFEINLKLLRHLTRIFY